MKIDYNAERHFFALGDEIVPHPCFQDRTYLYSVRVLQFFDFIRWLNKEVE